MRAACGLAEREQEVNDGPVPHRERKHLDIKPTASPPRILCQRAPLQRLEGRDPFTEIKAPPPSHLDMKRRDFSPLGGGVSPLPLWAASLRRNSA